MALGRFHTKPRPKPNQHVKHQQADFAPSSMALTIRPCPRAGSGVHTWLLGAANTCRNHGLSEESAETILHEETRTCGRLVSSREIAGAVGKAFQSKWTPGIALSPLLHTRLQYQPERLGALSEKAPAVDAEWLWERSPVRPDTMNAMSFLTRLYRVGERIHIFARLDSAIPKTTITITPPPWDCRSLEFVETGQQNVFFLPNPVDGQWYDNPRENRRSCRSEESIKEFRFALLESDIAPADQWLAALALFPIPIAAIYTSGGRSIHALWQVNATTKPEWDGLVTPCKPALKVLGADPAALSAVRPSRLPQCERRSKSGVQQLLYLNPNPIDVPLVEVPIRETRAAMEERLANMEEAYQ